MEQRTGGSSHESGSGTPQPPASLRGSPGRGAGRLVEVIITFPDVKGDTVPAFPTSVEGDMRQKQDVKDFNVC